jgi:hypothetical protein
MAKSVPTLYWGTDPDACIEYALAGAGRATAFRLSQYPLLAPDARPLTESAVGLLGRELHAARADPARFVTQYDALRHAVIVCRRWAIREALVSRPVQPLLWTLATSTRAADRALYRFVRYAYRDGFSLTDLADAMGYAREEAAERVEAAVLDWQDIVFAASGNAPCVESFPRPDALR